MYLIPMNKYPSVFIFSKVNNPSLLFNLIGVFQRGQSIHSPTWFRRSNRTQSYAPKMDMTGILFPNVISDDVKGATFESQRSRISNSTEKWKRLYYKERDVAASYGFVAHYGYKDNHPPLLSPLPFLSILFPPSGTKKVVFFILRPFLAAPFFLHLLPTIPRDQKLIVRPISSSQSTSGYLVLEPVFISFPSVLPARIV